MSRAGKKDVLAAGGRTMVIAGGVGDSPLLQKIHEEEAVGIVPQPVVEEVIKPFEKPALPQRKFNPNPGVYLIRQAENTTVTFSGIEDGLQANVPKNELVLVQDEKDKERPAEGFVVEAGQGTLYPVGTLVVFGKYAGTQFKLNGEVLLLMRDEDIFGSITKA